MTPQQIVDALEAGTLVIPADYREILQALATVINSASGGGEISGTPSTIPVFNVSGDGIEDSGISYNGTIGLDVVVADDQNVIFSQASQSPYLIIQNNATDCGLSVLNGSNDAGAQIEANATSGCFRAFSVDEESVVQIYATNGNTFLQLDEDSLEIFKASAAGISTDASTNTWQLGAASAGAPTADSKIVAIINGNTYLIAAELVP